MALLADLGEKGLKLFHALRMLGRDIVSLPEIDTQIVEFDRPLIIRRILVLTERQRKRG